MRKKAIQQNTVCIVYEAAQTYRTKEGEEKAIWKVTQTLQVVFSRDGTWIGLGPRTEVCFITTV